VVRAATIPAGSWPMEMRAETAAAYCDELSVDAFFAEVQRGTESRAMSERARGRSAIGGVSRHPRRTLKRERHDRTQPV
jgi:hypothetical protein